MTRSRFVQPATTNIPLSDGDWIEVKQALTYGEGQALYTSAVDSTLDMGEAGTGQPRTRFGLRMEAWAVKRICAWVVDWSFTDISGNKVEFSEQAVAALDEDTGKEIDAALTAHMAAIEARKKAPPAG